MSINVKINVDLGNLPVFLTDTSIKAVKQAISRSIARTVQGMNTQTQKSLRSKRILDLRQIPYNKLRQKYLITAKQNTGRDLAMNEMYGEIAFADRHLSLAYFFPLVQALNRRGPVLTKNGWRMMDLHKVSWEVGGKRKTSNKAFYVPKGKTGAIFQRKGAGRLPISKMYGPAMATTIEKNGVAAELEIYAEQRYQKEFETNLEYFLKRA